MEIGPPGAGALLLLNSEKLKIFLNLYCVSCTCSGFFLCIHFHVFVSKLNCTDYRITVAHVKENCKTLGLCPELASENCQYGHKCTFVKRVCDEVFQCTCVRWNVLLNGVLHEGFATVV